MSAVAIAERSGAIADCELDGLSNDQRGAYTRLRTWADRPCGILSMGGLAGTGKTFLTGRLAKDIERRRTVAYVAYTARAASVLRGNLPASIDTKPKAPSHIRRTPKTERVYSFRRDRSSYCGTLHSLLYRPILNEREEVIDWERRDEFDQEYDFVVVDEASMLADDALADLRRHQVPILAVGDHGQLPPVRGASSLMANPTIRLERIHRQAEGSRIIQLAHRVRADGLIDRSLADGDSVTITDDLDGVLRDAFGPERGSEDLLDVALVCWMNRTRNALNRRIRALRFGEDGCDPREGELVVNLHNWRPDGAAIVPNGLRGIVQGAAIEDEDEPWRLLFPVLFEGEKHWRFVAAVAAQFGRPTTFARVDELAACGIDVDRMGQAGQLFDFGYALTAHKAQGSGFTHAIVVTDMPASHADWRTWMYTAVTRAKSKLTIITRRAQ